jgi:hypothetical protein
VFYKHYAEVPSINFRLETSDDLASILHFRGLACKWLIVSNGAVFLLTLVAWGLVSLVLWQKDQEHAAISQQVTQLGGGLNNVKIDSVNHKKFIKKVVDLNVKANNFLVKLGTSVQQNIWLDKVQMDLADMEKPPVAVVEGKALELGVVNTLLTPLNTILVGGNLQVSNAAPVTSDDGQTYFTWSIQNQGTSVTANPSAAPGG